MKITRNRIREIVKETLDKKLVEQEPAEISTDQVQGGQGDEPRDDVGKLLNLIIGASGNEERIKILQQRCASLNPEKKSRVVNALVGKVLGFELDQQKVRAAVQKGMQDK